MTRFRRKANHAHVYDLVRRSETHVTIRSAIESVLPIQTFEEDYEPAPDADSAPKTGAIVDEVALESERRDVPDPHLRRLSTPSTQIGKAGAGPAGAAVVFEFDRYIDGTLMAEGVKIERQPTLEKASRRAAQIASRGPNGEIPVLVLRSTIYARPAEEPGEVERAKAEACKPWEFATGEPPEWDSPLHQVFVAGMTYSERLLAKFLKVQTYEGGDGSEDFDCDATMSLVNIIAAAGLWDKDEYRPAAEAELAEMRTALRRSQRALMSLPGPQSLEVAECIATNRAALTGDAQEGGRSSGAPTWGRWFSHDDAPRGSYACLTRLQEGAQITLAWMPAQGRPNLPGAIVMPFLMPGDAQEGGE